MDQGRSDFLRNEVRDADLSEWVDILPARYSVLTANLFADIFVVDEAGAVHMLEVSAASIAKIAECESEFRRRCIDDEDGWLLRPLVDQCRSAGLIPSETQCYAFTTLPLFGGEYEPGNVWLCSWDEWISFTASIYVQTKDLPDDTTISFKVVD